MVAELEKSVREHCAEGGAVSSLGGCSGIRMHAVHRELDAALTSVAGVDRSDIPIDVDLGELIEGHHVIARSLTSGHTVGASLSYVIAPALSDEEEGGFAWYWMLYASDDLGTEYRDWNSGAFGPSADGETTEGDRDIGGDIPSDASWLLLRFEPPSEWSPPVPWTREIRVDLHAEGTAEGPRFSSMLVTEVRARKDDVDVDDDGP